MAVPSSGQLRLYADIGVELGVTQSNVSLGAMSNSVGFTDPDAMSEFYGWPPSPVPQPVAPVPQPVAPQPVPVPQPVAPVPQPVPQPVAPVPVPQPVPVAPVPQPVPQPVAPVPVPAPSPVADPTPVPVPVPQPVAPVPQPVAPVPVPVAPVPVPIPTPIPVPVPAPVSTYYYYAIDKCDGTFPNYLAVRSSIAFSVGKAVTMADGNCYEILGAGPANSDDWVNQYKNCSLC